MAFIEGLRPPFQNALSHPAGNASLIHLFIHTPCKSTYIVEKKGLWGVMRTETNKWRPAVGAMASPEAMLLEE